jgi:hypothetical protein
MSAESKLVGAKAEGGDVPGSQEFSSRATEAAEGTESGEEPAETTNVGDAPSGAATKKKKSKKKRTKGIVAGEDAPSSSSGPGESSAGSNKLPSAAVDSLLRVNPSLQSEVKGMGKEKAEDLLRKLNVSDLLTGMVRNA